MALDAGMVAIVHRCSCPAGLQRQDPIRLDDIPPRRCLVTGVLPGRSSGIDQVGHGPHQRSLTFRGALSRWADPAYKKQFAELACQAVEELRAATAALA
jgi:hypothetical protein